MPSLIVCFSVCFDVTVATAAVATTIDIEVMIIEMVRMRRERGVIQRYVSCHVSSSAAHARKFTVVITTRPIARIKY